MPVKNNLTKAERLHSKTLIDKLFKNGTRKYSYGIIFYNLLTDKTLSTDHKDVSIIVVARKKQFKHAVDRNRIKRLFREAYRNNKYILDNLIPDDKHLMLGMIYVGNGLPEYSFCFKHVQNYLTTLATQFKNQLK